ncbi:zinc-ribbon domain-containing protein [Desulfovibrio sp.]|uniref:zinc-ribbon domain-containing protein n=1 Tax=Desulfovibrio sp. TaxID=885 RepID=UPI0023D4E8A3|nr:zinc-ribbon domain-containing protein [Desulfovibrio sp.]MDE7240372.1 zinc-ribbon domain-containing protein [Desulfovibrio sp.]
MNIECPQCGFSRRLPEDRLPGEVVIATCPQCACRFRFSVRDGVLTVLPPRGEDRAHGADAPARSAPATPMTDAELPPGAVIPGRDEEAPSSDAPQPAREGAHSPKAQAEEEEDIRETARRAYAREAARFSGPDAEAGATPAAAQRWDVNPWDAAPANGGWLQAFYQTVLRVMFAAPRFFAGLRPHARQVRPLGFYLVICVIQTVVERFWGSMIISALTPSAATDPQLERLLELLAPKSDLALSLLLRCGLLVLQLYVFAALMFLAYRLVARERTSFSLVFQVMAYSSAPALLCVVPALGSLAGMIWGLACLAVGCRAALRLNWPQTLFGFVPLILVFGPLLLQAMTAVQG